MNTIQENEKQHGKMEAKQNKGEKESGMQQEREEDKQSILLRGNRSIYPGRGLISASSSDHFPWQANGPCFTRTNKHNKHTQAQ